MKMTKWDHLRSNKYGLYNGKESHAEQLYMCLIKDHMSGCIKFTTQLIHYTDISIAISSEISIT